MAALGHIVTRLADRRLDHEWGAELQSLWHGANYLRDAVLTLEAVAERDRARDGAWGVIDGALAAADFAAAALLRVEELAAPLLREMAIWEMAAQMSEAGED